MATFLLDPDLDFELDVSDQDPDPELKTNRTITIKNMSSFIILTTVLLVSYMIVKLPYFFFNALIAMRRP
jgi:hypothetical protein